VYCAEDKHNGSHQALAVLARRKTHSASRGCVLYNLGNFAADFISHDGGLACYDYDIVLIIIIQTSLQVHRGPFSFKRGSGILTSAQALAFSRL